jgi:hypothetical protein
MDVGLLKYPKKSHRKEILIPEESMELAEFMGIEFGDGGINNPWQVIISLNSVEDAKYSIYVSSLIRNLFGLSVYFRYRTDEKCVHLTTNSTTLVDFLLSKGAVFGNKVAQNFDVPVWIYKKDEYKKTFVKGLFDTDGGFYTHKHRVLGHDYINLGFCFATASSFLLDSVRQILIECGINPHSHKKGRHIYLYKGKDLERYMSLIGSSNPRLIDKFEKYIKK